MRSLLKNPSAWVPIALSAVMLVVMLVLLTTTRGAPPEQDEGVGAHLFQLWLVIEAASITFFAVRWIPQGLKQTVQVLALQITAAMVPVVIVFSLKL